MEEGLLVALYGVLKVLSVCLLIGCFHVILGITGLVRSFSTAQTVNHEGSQPL